MGKKVSVEPRAGVQRSELSKHGLSLTAQTCCSIMFNPQLLKPNGINYRRLLHAELLARSDLCCLIKALLEEAFVLPL